MFWRSLGVGSDLVDEFAEADILWDGTYLNVNNGWERDRRGLERVAALVLYSLQWVSFSLTRWVKVGHSARLFFRSLACGVEGLVELCRQDTAVSMYHMNGFSRAKESERLNLAVAAFCSNPCETWLAEVMSADRVLRRSAELRSALEEALLFLTEPPHPHTHGVALWRTGGHRRQLEVFA